MKKVLLFLLCVTLQATGQPVVTLPPGATSGGAAPQPSGETALQIEVVAMKGSASGRSTTFVDDELKPYKKLLDTLEPNDTFEIIAKEAKPVSLNVEERFTVNGLYTAYVKPLGTRDTPEGGQRFELEMRVEMLQGNDYVDALRARGEAAERQALVLRGMDLDIGELIVLVRVVPDGEDSPGDSQSGDEEETGEEKEQQDEQQEQQAQQDEKDEQRDSENQEEMGDGEAEQQPPELRAEQEGEPEGQPEGEQSMAEQQSSGQEGESEAEAGPQDMQTIEAILESLEEKDRQEQKNARYRRSQVIIRGDWW